MTTSLKSGDLVELAIDAVAHGGDGIGRVSGQVCFVTGALPGDTVRARVFLGKARASWAHLQAVLSPSPSRLLPSICVEQVCASACVWHAFAYPEQAVWKQRIVAGCLERIGGISVPVSWEEQADLRLGYRTRAVFHGDGEKMGYYEQRTHKVVPMRACPLNHSRLNDAFQALQLSGARHDVHLTVNPEGEETLVFLHDDNEQIRRRFVMANMRSDPERFQFLFDGVPIVNGAFSQSSLLLNRMLRAHVDACVGTPGTLLDLYCGNGNLSLHLLPNAAVTGIDHSGPAVAAAALHSKGSYIRGDEAVMTAYLEQKEWDVVLLDPPRTGAAMLVDALAKAKAKRLVYVSCNPATLARDLRGILSGGWNLRQTTALDMFPHTPHVETVCVLER